MGVEALMGKMHLTKLFYKIRETWTYLISCEWLRRCSLIIWTYFLVVLFCVSTNYCTLIVPHLSEEASLVVSTLQQGCLFPCGNITAVQWLSSRWHSWVSIWIMHLKKKIKKKAYSGLATLCKIYLIKIYKYVYWKDHTECLCIKGAKTFALMYVCMYEFSSNSWLMYWSPFWDFVVPQPLVELHVKLLRKLGKSVTSDRWEKYLVKVNETFNTWHCVYLV